MECTRKRNGRCLGPSEARPARAVGGGKNRGWVAAGGSGGSPGRSEAHGSTTAGMEARWLGSAGPPGGYRAAARAAGGIKPLPPLTLTRPSVALPGGYFKWSPQRLSPRSMGRRSARHTATAAPSIGASSSTRAAATAQPWSQPPPLFPARHPFRTRTPPYRPLAPFHGLGQSSPARRTWGG